MNKKCWHGSDLPVSTTCTQQPMTTTAAPNLFHSKYEHEANTMYVYSQLLNNFIVECIRRRSDGVAGDSAINICMGAPVRCGADSKCLNVAAGSAIGANHVAALVLSSARLSKNTIIIMSLFCKRTVHSFVHLAFTRNNGVQSTTNGKSEFGMHTELCTRLKAAVFCANRRDDDNDRYSVTRSAITLSACHSSTSSSSFIIYSLLSIPSVRTVRACFY